MKKCSRTAKRWNSCRLWSKSDLKTFKRLYPHNYNFRLARMFGRTIGAIRQASERLGLHKEYDDKFKPLRTSDWTAWSDEEVRILKNMFPTHPLEEISDSIDRTPGGICGKARKLKLKRYKFSLLSNCLIRKTL